LTAPPVGQSPAQEPDTVEAKPRFVILLAVLAGTAHWRGVNRAGQPAAGRHYSPSCRACRRWNCQELAAGGVAPLIYSASVAMSWREFKYNLRPIILLSVGCVIFTAFAVAAATLSDRLPWASASRSAIVAPPDVVAPLAIARKLGLPRHPRRPRGGTTPPR
jgi:hypothetical protein